MNTAHRSSRGVTRRAFVTAAAAACAAGAGKTHAQPAQPALPTDSEDHVPPEDETSCTVEPWMADYVVDNNGSLAELEQNILQLLGRTMP